jgi:hypothetical protein
MVNQFPSLPVTVSSENLPELARQCLNPIVSTEWMQTDPFERQGII